MPKSMFLRSQIKRWRRCKSHVRPYWSSRISRTIISITGIECWTLSMSSNVCGYQLSTDNYSWQESKKRCEYYHSVPNLEGPPCQTRKHTPQRSKLETICFICLWKFLTLKEWSNLLSLVFSSSYQSY